MLCHCVRCGISLAAVKGTGHGEAVPTPSIIGLASDGFQGLRRAIDIRGLKKQTRPDPSVRKGVKEERIGEASRRGC